MTTYQPTLSIQILNLPTPNPPYHPDSDTALVATTTATTAATTAVATTTATTATTAATAAATTGDVGNVLGRDLSDADEKVRPLLLELFKLPKDIVAVIVKCVMRREVAPADAAIDLCGKGTLQLTTLQLYNLTTLQPCNFTPLQPYNLTT